MRATTTSAKNERGLLSTELAILMPIMLLFALLAIYVVQVERHSSRAQQAADAAARAASLVIGETEARNAAQAAAEAVCVGGSVLIDDGGWVYEEPKLDDFTPGRVAVSLSCTTRFSAFEPLVQNSVRTDGGRAVSTIEYWRPGP